MSYLVILSGSLCPEKVYTFIIVIISGVVDHIVTNFSRQLRGINQIAHPLISRSYLRNRNNITIVAIKSAINNMGHHKCDYHKCDCEYWSDLNGHILPSRPYRKSSYVLVSEL